MELTILVGAKKHVLTLGESCIVRELMETVAEKSQIKEINQKLIFKGVTLTKEPDKLLSEFGIKSGSKIMVIGKRYDSEEEAALITFQDMEKSVTKITRHMEDLKKQSDSVLNGFLQKQYKTEALEKINKEIQQFLFTLTKHLETIDSMTLSVDFKDAKIKRKSVVDKIQDAMDKCEATSELIEDNL